MKTAVSIPDELFLRADSLARRRRLSRSALFATALREYVDRHVDEDVTDRLNAVYRDHPATLDPVVTQLQCSSLPAEQW